MKKFLGIDGGGTKTRCVLIDEKMNILFRAESSASNPLVVGFKKSAYIIAGLILQAFKYTKQKKIEAIVAGLAGAGRKTDAEKIKEEILNLLVKEKNKFGSLFIITDAEAAIAGAFAGKPGAIIISGTGSIVQGVDANGNIFRSGGYGKIIGDIGSGYSIGKKGLYALAKQYDGFKQNTFLVNVFEEKFGVTNLDELIQLVYSKDFDIASIASYVIKCANKGDKICKKILDTEVNKLVKLLNLMKRKMKVKKLNVAFVGGLISSKNYFSNSLKDAIINFTEDITIKKSKYKPEIGAALLARKYS